MTGEPEQLRVCEIFVSIQGESTFAGLPCVFVRTTGCPLRCRWCDTRYAFDEGELISLDDVCEQALSPKVPLVEVTGGEPLAQPPTSELLRRLCDAGRTVLLETSGAADIALVDPRVHVIMDLKCPDSGESERNHWPNIERLRSKDEVKLVIASRRDYEYACDVIDGYRLAERCGAVLLSAETQSVSPEQLAAWMLADELPARLQLQLHKLIWPTRRRGV